MSNRELAAKAKTSTELLGLLLLNSADEIFVVDRDYRFAFLHSPRQLPQSNNGNGKLCYESILGKSVPCDFCPVSNGAMTQCSRTVAAFDRGEKQYELKISSLTNGDEKPLYLHFLRDSGTAAYRDAEHGDVQQLQSRFRQAAARNHLPIGIEAFVGTSLAWLAVKKQLEAVMPFPTVSVLLEGETGTGKELIAEILHNGTFGNKAPFIPINCPAIPDHLLESELFGYEKGAFTDASQAKPGLFELAQGGTLFLDEIGSLSLNLQPKLLRVLETKTFTRLGSIKKISINCRIICASNRPLRIMVEEGKFREDLYQRVSTLTVTIPPLRERLGDIARLVQAFIYQTAQEIGKEVGGITPDALAALEAYDWPGNVRELKKVIERAVILTPKGELIDTPMVPQNVSQRSSDGPTPLLPLRDLEKQHLDKILALCRGNKSQAAKLLRISRTTLRKKLHEYHL